MKMSHVFLQLATLPVAKFCILANGIPHPRSNFNEIILL